ncbi:MAG: ADOP family duplicated permease [Acidobacteriota bacterium]
MSDRPVADSGQENGRRPATPPRLARWILRCIVPAEMRDGAVDDLDERFTAYASSSMGTGRARRWYWRQVFGGLHPSLWRRGHDPRLPDKKGRSGLTLNVMHDVRFGARMLARNPGTTAVIVLMLAVGLGFNGAVFSLANTIILNDLPIEQPQRVLFVDSDNPSQGRDSLYLSYPDYRDFVAGAHAFASWSAMYQRSMNLADRGNVPERYPGAAVEPSVFDVLQIQPLLGRRLEASDAQPGAAAVALIGYNVWQARYGADPDILGRVVQVNAEPVTVVGVLPPELERTPFRPALWVPLIPTEDMRNARDRRFLLVAGRLRDGASQAEATAELEQIADRLAAEHRDTNEGIGVVVGTFGEMYTDTGNRVITLVMMGAVMFLLLIACANVANLLVSRSIQRSREVVIRSALGASRSRVVRQLLVESLMLGGLAAIAASFLAVLGARMLERAIAAAAPPEFWDFSVRPSVFVVIVALSALTSLLFGLMPALHATRRDVSESLKEGGRSSGGRRTRRLTGALVVAQVALSLVLLAGAGVMVRSTLNILDVDWVIDPADVLTMRVTLPQATYPERDNIVAFYEQLERSLAPLPGVESVALSSTFPGNVGYTVSAELEERPMSDGNPAAVWTQLIVSPSYFDLADLRPLRGRLFDRRDGLDAEPVAVVERRSAERFWPGEDVVGKRFRWVGETETRWVTIVGVVPDVTQALELDFIPIRPLVYTSFEQEPLRGMGVIVKSPADPATLATLLREQVAELDANLPVYDVATLHDFLGERTAGWRIVSGLFVLLGAIALFLASVGIYAVMAFAVGTRQQEIGIRMALGARGREVIGLVARTSLVQIVVGLLLGLAGAVALTRVLGIFMYGVSPTDPLTFALVFVILVGTTLAALLAPARRASSVSPVEALRDE